MSDVVCAGNGDLAADEYPRGGAGGVDFGLWTLDFGFACARLRGYPSAASPAPPILPLSLPGPVVIMRDYLAAARRPVVRLVTGDYRCTIRLLSWAPRRRRDHHPPVAGSRRFPFKTIKFLASRRSAGKKMTYAGKEYAVEELRPEAFQGVQLAIASTPDEVARDFVPEAVKRGCVVVDESAFLRMDPKVPLVIPEVNPHDICKHQGIIASPNCSTTQMVVALKPLHDSGRVKRVIVSSYQATSGAGVAGTRDLEGGTRAHLADQDYPLRVLRLPHRLQRHSADRLAQVQGLHLGRDEDGVRDPQDHGRRVDPGLRHVRAGAGEQLP